jgi:hypothetical protein
MPERNLCRAYDLGPALSFTCAAPEVNIFSMGAVESTVGYGPSTIDFAATPEVLLARRIHISGKSVGHSTYKNLGCAPDDAGMCVQLNSIERVGRIPIDRHHHGDVDRSANYNDLLAEQDFRARKFPALSTGSQLLFFVEPSFPDRLMPMNNFCSGRVDGDRRIAARSAS